MVRRIYLAAICRR